MAMSGKQLAGWLRALANQVEHLERIEVDICRSGPVTVPVPSSAALRSWKHRHGSVDPPSVAHPLHELVRSTIRETLREEAATLPQRFRNAFATLLPELVHSVALHLSSKYSKELAVVTEPDRPSRAPEYSGPPAAPGIDLNEDSNDRETPLPLDFRLHSAAVAELSEKLGHEPAVIEAAVEEFRSYWTIGGGTGRRRDHWQRRCRDDIRRKAERGDLDRIASRLGIGDRREPDPVLQRRLAATERRIEMEKQEMRERGAAQGKGPVPTKGTEQRETLANLLPFTGKK